MGYKIAVDFDKCISSANCMKNAPEVFEVREDGYLYVLNEDPGGDMRESVERAARGCPTRAISIEDI